MSYYYYYPPVTGYTYEHLVCWLLDVWERLVSINENIVGEYSKEIITSWIQEISWISCYSQHELSNNSSQINYLSSLIWNTYCTYCHTNGFQCKCVEGPYGKEIWKQNNYLMDEWCSNITIFRISTALLTLLSNQLHSS